MSIEAMGWAWRQDVQSKTELLVLLAIADCADSHTFEAWPSYQHLADRARVQRRTAIRAAMALEARGLLEITRRKAGAKNQSNVFHVPVDRPVQVDILTREEVADDTSDNQTLGTPATPGSDTSDTRVVSPATPGTIIEPSKNRGRRLRRCPPDFKPRPEDLEKMSKECPSVDIDAEFRLLKDHEFDKPRKDKDWDAVFRNWIRKAAKFEKPRPARRMSIQQATVLALKNNIARRQNFDEDRQRLVPESDDDFIAHVAGELGVAA